MSGTDFEAYVDALSEVADLPRAHAGEREAIVRHAAAEVDALDRSRRDVAARWVSMRDTAARLSRRVEELAVRVDVPPAGSAGDVLLAPTAIPQALESLRAEVVRAEDSWQWLQRHRERRAAPAPPPSIPSYPPQPTPPAPPPPAPDTGNSRLLLGAGAAVIVILILVIIVMAI